MEIVNTLDIDGTQWEIQDAEARQNVNILKTFNEQKFAELDTALDNKADKSYVEKNFANKNEVVKDEITETTFITPDNIIYKQGRICTVSIIRLLVDKTYNYGEILGYIGNPSFYPRRQYRGLILRLNDSKPAEIMINEDGTITIGQAGPLTPDYWVGNYSWTAK